MFKYKLIKATQPFCQTPYDHRDSYNKFETELLELLNSGYEIVHTEDMENEYIHNEECEAQLSKFKLFILRRAK